MTHIDLLYSENCFLLTCILAVCYSQWKDGGGSWSNESVFFFTIVLANNI